MSTKEEFIHQALAKEISFTQLCLNYKITRKTGYRILKRYLEEGYAGLIPRSKKPLSSPSKTSDKIEKAIINLRIEKPTWGAKKILAFFKKKNKLDLPSKTTINVILKRHNLITIEESLKRKEFIRFEREHPNDLWQMDFKGHFQLLTKQLCYPLTILDDHSRFSLSIKACKNEQYLTVKTYLTNIFKCYGLPAQINVDNGNPWGNSKLLPYTALTIWLMQLGVRVSHSRPRHPQTNGKLERFHRTLKEDIISRYPMRSLSHAQKLFDKWRHEYNHVRPHEAIGMKAPAERYKSSTREFPNKLPTIEYAPGSILRKVRGNGFISYGNQEYQVGESFAGHHIEVKHDEVNKSIGLYFREFEIYNYDQ